MPYTLQNRCGFRVVCVATLLIGKPLRSVVVSCHVASKSADLLKAKRLDMPETNITSDSDALSPARYAAIFAAWLVPGLGHLLLKRRGRAAVIFLCVGGLAVAGYAMRGQAYSMRAGDMFGFMGYLAEIGSGAFYFLARLLEPRGADTALVAGVYGTRFLAIAGLLNFLCALDVYAIAQKERS